MTTDMSDDNPLDALTVENNRGELYCSKNVTSLHADRLKALIEDGDYKTWKPFNEKQDLYDPDAPNSLRITKKWFLVVAAPTEDAVHAPRDENFMSLFRVQVRSLVKEGGCVFLRRHEDDSASEFVEALPDLPQRFMQKTDDEEGDKGDREKFSLKDPKRMPDEEKVRMVYAFDKVDFAWEEDVRTLIASWAMDMFRHVESPNDNVLKAFEHMSETIEVHSMDVADQFDTIREMLRQNVTNQIEELDEVVNDVATFFERNYDMRLPADQTSTPLIRALDRTYSSKELTEAQISPTVDALNEILSFQEYITTTEITAVESKLDKKRKKLREIKEHLAKLQKIGKSSSSDQKKQQKKLHEMMKATLEKVDKKDEIKKQRQALEEKLKRTQLELAAFDKMNA